jgi:outer membrane protein assembly factor BamD (BamD/ComL family)
MKGSFGLASKTAQKGIELSEAGEYAERMQLLVAELYLEQQNYKAALAEYKRFKNRYPNSAMMGSVDFIVPQLEAEIAKQN